MKGIIEIPKSLWNLKGKRQVYVYALDSSCIGVCIHPMKEWNVALYKTIVFISETPKNWIFAIPNSLSLFYGITLKDTKVTSSVDMKGEHILIVVERFP